MLCKPPAVTSRVIRGHSARPVRVGACVRTARCAIILTDRVPAHLGSQGTGEWIFAVGAATVSVYLRRFSLSFSYCLISLSLSFSLSLSLSLSLSPFLPIPFPPLSLAHSPTSLCLVLFHFPSLSLLSYLSLSLSSISVYIALHCLSPFLLLLTSSTSLPTPEVQSTMLKFSIGFAQTRTVTERQNVMSRYSSFSFIGCLDRSQQVSFHLHHFALVCSCQYRCPAGTYGQGCNMKCQCQNGGTCDPVDGTCACFDGYIGTQYVFWISCEYAVVFFVFLRKYDVSLFGFFSVKRE